MVFLAWSLLRDAPSKSLGTLIGVVMSVFLMAQQLSVLLGIVARVAAFAGGSDVDVWVASPATENSDTAGTMPASRVGQAASTPGVAWAGAVLQGMSSVTRPDGAKELVKVVGVEAPRYAGLPRSLGAGTTAAGLRGAGRIFLNANDRPVYGFPAPGDRLEIGGQTAVVGGFFEQLDPHSPYGYVFANLDDARAYTGVAADRITFVAVGAAPGVSPDEVKRRLAARIGAATVFTRAELQQAEIRYFLARTPVGVVFGTGTAAAALIGAFIVAITLYSNVIDRLRDYGTLKAIGATRGDLLRLLLAQTWLLYGAGLVLGLAAFFAVKHAAPSAPMQAPPWMLASVAAAAFVSCTAASLVAVRRVLAVDPAMVFRG